MKSTSPGSAIVEVSSGRHAKEVHYNEVRDPSDVYMPARGIL